MAWLNGNFVGSLRLSLTTEKYNNESFSLKSRAVSADKEKRGDEQRGGYVQSHDDVELFAVDKCLC